VSRFELSDYQYIDIKISPRPSSNSDPRIILTTSSDLNPHAGGIEGFEIVMREIVSGNAPRRTELVVSLGQKSQVRMESLRKAGGMLAQWLTRHHVAYSYLELSTLEELGIPGVSPEAFPGAFSAFCEGVLLGAYRFDRYKTMKDRESRVCLHLVAKDGVQEKEAELRRLAIITSAANLAREWGHEPGSVLNPVTLTTWVEQLAKMLGLECSILDEAGLAQIGAGGILSVGMGSQSPPRLVAVRCPGAEPDLTAQPVVLVGKAVTFDTGGYSMKDIQLIQGMKYDKCGATAVIGAMAALAQLEIPHPVVAVLPMVENMVSRTAFRPDDIVTLFNGETVEIVTTDAEGRLILADALTYAQQEFSPGCIIDIATLTSGIVTALGRVRAGMFSNHDPLAEQLIRAGDRTNELVWRMPLDPEYLANMRSDEADLKNAGGKEGHPIYGGVFLNHFINPAVPWAHLDITGMASTNKDLGYCPKGATGFGVRLLVDFLQHLEA
jgi:leucyl aminopeptidase